MTDDALTKHRLEQLEEFAAGWHAAERKVDTLSLSLAALERSVAKIDQSLEKNEHSMSRLHARLDEALRESEREKGREEGREEARAEIEAAAVEKGRQQGLAEARKTNWRVVAVVTPIALTAMLGVVALLNLILN